MTGVRDYSSTAASNLSVGGIGIQEGMARSSVNNAARATLADTANLLLDLGGETVTTGSGNAFLLSLPSAPTAYASNLSFVCKLHHAVTGPATLNLNGIGVKPIKKLVHGVLTDLTNGDGAAGHRASCIYSTGDNCFLMLNAGGGGSVYFADDIDDALAIPDLRPGASVYVGGDQFVVVDDATLATDGGTVFIPDSELSAIYEEAIPPTYFLGAVGANVAMEYSLAHEGIDFDSVELVLGDDDETIDVWMLNGHVMQPIYADRTATPQLPLIDTGRGKFRDPLGVLTGFHGVPPTTIHPPVRTGGVLVRYKYALSGLRLKRVTGPVFELRWWPVIAVDDEEVGVQTDNSGKICWAANAAAAAGAEAVYVDKMYHYARCVEWPEGVELRGRGPGVSGFRVMDNMQHTQLLLSASIDGAAANPALNPLLKPATRLWVYDDIFFANATAFYPATGATRIRISEIEFDGNIDNNLRLFSEQDAEYAYTYSAANFTLGNVPSACAFAVSNVGGRVIPEGQIVELHNVKMHGYGSHILAGNDKTTFICTGMLELGNTCSGHWLYLCRGVYDRVRVFGYCNDDGLRVDQFIAKSVEFILAPPPDVMFDITGNYANGTMQLISFTEYMPQQQSVPRGYLYPTLSPFRIVIDHLFVDATGLDTFPAGKTYCAATPLFINGDNVHIKSGKMRFGQLTSAATTIFNADGNVAGGHPYRNQVYENLSIEYSSRTGIALMASGSVDGGFAEAQFRNITLEARASTHIPGNPSPAGVSSSLGVWRFKETVLAEPTPPAYNIAYDGRDVEFSAVTVDATLNGKYIDITPPDPAAPTYRYWFNYNSGGSAPAAGGNTLVTVPVAAGATTAALAAAFSLAVAGTIASPAVSAPYLTAATFNTKSAIGAYSHYRSDVKGGYVAISLAAAAGVTTVLRSYHRNYEPSMIGFERFIANDRSYAYLMNILEVGTNRDINFTFKDCVFGAYFTSVIYLNGGGNFNAAGTSAPDLIKDKVHWIFEDSTFDLRDGSSWSSLDLFLYAGRFRNCRIRTPSVATGIPALSTGYETLFSEQGGTEEWTTPGAAVPVFRDIQTKLFWLPKDGQARLYPANAATWLLWNTVSFEWLKKGSIALGGSGSYYQGPATISEDRRAPVLRLNFSVAPPINTPLKFAWSAAVSP